MSDASNEWARTEIARQLGRDNPTVTYQRHLAETRQELADATAEHEAFVADEDQPRTAEREAEAERLHKQVEWLGKYLDHVIADDPDKPPKRTNPIDQGPMGPLVDPNPPTGNDWLRKVSGYPTERDWP